METANNGHYFIFNSTELRLVDFPMVPTAVQRPAPTIRRTLPSRSTRRVRSEAVRESTTGKTFRMPVDVENQILALCW